ncbi:uncharacterized protein LOC143222758 isoform X1 [Tachypleus tridentatus]|uniref:uncharacterized protein LOC143222758 isoform X1 n=1 Tax=Tachypleus tridentatus TaxID=6853 RepID=UPI003FD5234D
MLRKYPKSGVSLKLSRFWKGLFVLEGVFFCGTFCVYYKLNTSRDFRHWMFNTNFTALDGFYRIGEFFGDTSVRNTDYKVWGIEGK